MARCSPYGYWDELERIELGDRAAHTYDEAFSIAYRIGAALGIPRPQVPLDWQRNFQEAPDGVR